MPTIDDLIVEYRSTANAWDALHSDAKNANPFVRLHVSFKQLRTDPAGRDAISALMDDSNVGVRLSASSPSLAWSPEKAANVLETIHAGPGLHAVSAKYTLKAFREGTLDMDWYMVATGMARRQFPRNVGR